MQASEEEVDVAEDEPESEEDPTEALAMACGDEEGRESCAHCTSRNSTRV